MELLQNLTLSTSSHEENILSWPFGTGEILVIEISKNASLLIGKYSLQTFQTLLYPSKVLLALYLQCVTSADLLPPLGDNRRQQQELRVFCEFLGQPY